MNIEDWKRKNAHPKRYAHFDKRVALRTAWDYISNSEKVTHHGFYPFVHYQQKFNKFNSVDGIKLKERELCYAAHIDRYIYSYYGFLLNEKYNQRVVKDGFTDSAVAYRTDLNKNNIHFAKEAIDFIRTNAPCYVVVGDFTHFFDKLNHQYLKKQLCNLLECESLPSDYYAVFKNITRYSIWDLDSLLLINGLEDTKSSIKELNQRAQLLTAKQFRQNKKECIRPHKEVFGIPQGSPISAILSNIYMLDFDKKVRQFCDNNFGLYMRYSDDFIIVLPEISGIPFSEQLKKIQGFVSGTEGLELQEEKTQLYFFDDTQIKNISAEYLTTSNSGNNSLNYLGFTFDGKTVTIRDKTISKYYYRMRRKANFIVKSGGYTKTGKRISNKNLYYLYSIKGANTGNGNFLTYVQRAERIFGKDEAINRGTKSHMHKIKKLLNGNPNK